jgi:hypothetical protein
MNMIDKLDMMQENDTMKPTKIIKEWVEDK